MIGVSFGQRGIRISYFDKKGLLASEDEALYYRKSTDTINFYRSFYVKTKMPFFTGYIKSANDSSDLNNRYYGTCQWYYPNGRLQKENPYDEQGNLNGTCKEYFENGQLKNEYEYTLNKRSSYYHTEYNIYNDRFSVFEDNFSTNANNWPVSNNDSGYCKLKLGGIELMNTKASAFLKRSPVSPSNKNYSIEVSINANYLTDSLRAGIVFDYKDALNYSYFFASRLSLYSGKISNGKEVKILNNFHTTVLDPINWNKLQVTKIGDTLIYSINNELATFILDTAINARYDVGLGLMRQGPVLFDNFQIKTSEKAIPFTHFFKKDHFQKMLTDDYGITGTSMGLVLSDNGLLLTRYKPVQHANQIFVSAYSNTDSLTHFIAKVKAKNEFWDLAILEISNLDGKTLFQPAYTFFSKPELPKKLSAKAWCLKKTGLNHFKNDSLNASLESTLLGGYTINTSSNHLTQTSIRMTLSGTVFFALEGELIGMLSDEPSKNAKLQSIGILNSFLFQAGVSLQKNKSAKLSDVYKNIVNIRTR